MDGETGRVLWQYHTDGQMLAGLVPTKSGILFAGDVRGNLLALDAKTGFLLNRIDAKGALNNGLISYAVDDRQYVAAAIGGTSLNTSGVAGPLRVSIYGLNGSDTPKIVKSDRLPLLGPTREAKAHMMYFQNCQLCHGPAGQGGVYPSLLRQAKTVTDPNALKAFLVTVPPPMPRLYPGVLEDGDVDLIAEYLKAAIGRDH
jgi:hypothetical protein